MLLLTTLCVDNKNFYKATTSDSSRSESARKSIIHHREIPLPNKA